MKKDKQLLLQGAEAVFDNIMEGLADMGIDMKNPAEIMITCKELGPEYLERAFGLGSRLTNTQMAEDPSGPQIWCAAWKRFRTSACRILIRRSPT